MYWNALQSLSSTPSDDAASSTAALPSSHPKTSKDQSASTGKIPSPPKKPGKASAISQDTKYTAEQDSETEVNEVPLADELIDSFLHFLEKSNIELMFFSGAWQNFPNPSSAEAGYDLVLTSETVYELENLEYLTDLLVRAAGPAIGRKDQTTLVACKRVYFGVGGGEVAFKHAMERRGVEVDNIWHSGSGVERTVMKVRWH